jgi:aryl-alcohol dehydrogenase-like predicted oxidoreductase
MLDNLRHLADEKKASLAQLVLCWTINQPGITIALAGARNAQQAIENARSADINLSAEDLDFIHGELQAFQLEPA